MANSEEKTTIHFGNMFSFLKILLHQHIFPCVSIPTFVWKLWTRMNIRQENETSETFFLRTAFLGIRWMTSTVPLWSSKE